MPWDDTSLWVADVAADGSVAGQRQVRSCTLRQHPLIHLGIRKISENVVLPAWRWHAALHPWELSAARVATLAADGSQSHALPGTVMLLT